MLIFLTLIASLFAGLPVLYYFTEFKTPINIIIFAALFIASVIINIYPERNKYFSKRIYFLSSGSRLLKLFSISSVICFLGYIVLFFSAYKEIFPWRDGSGTLLLKIIGAIIFNVITEFIIFANGILRVYFTSVQLGIKHRFLAALFAFMPIVNIYFLAKIIRLCTEEVETENSRHLLDEGRNDAKICKTKYPILLVHGVFFRDTRYLNYWGRIPDALTKNGATVYYGSQESADTVEDCGRQLAQRINDIVEKTGCEKVNIIAHSKGGLDSRMAISAFGAEDKVASLTTINTPHRGCIFAEYLLNKAPERLKASVADAYNSTLLKLGDTSPDFLGAVGDLTKSKCEEMNEAFPDSPKVLYESVMSYCAKAKSGKFPLNISYPLVKHFDGKNDGLVSIDSAQWGTSFRLVTPLGKRGISHGDMIDLNRENIPDFDVREFYVSLVSSLKERGY